MTEASGRYYYLLWSVYGEVIAEVLMLLIQIKINKMIYVDSLESDSTAAYFCTIATSVLELLATLTDILQNYTMGM